jgi:hypothetical protein
MNIPQKHQTELAKICESLRQAVSAPSLDSSKQILSETLRRAERLSENLGNVAAKLGKKGGQKTAERGPDYFRKIAAMRKTKRGGKPPKAAMSASTPVSTFPLSRFRVGHQ